MDGRAAISDNLESLKRILGGLFAMMEIGQSAAACGQSDSATAKAAEDHPDCRLPVADERVTLPRHLRLAILRLLRPAESAARRLIIAAARGLVVALPPLRNTAPKSVDPVPMLRRFGIAVVVSPEDIARTSALRRAMALHTTRPRRLALPLFDSPRRFSPRSARNVPAHAAPRIMLPGVTQPHILSKPPSRDDAIDCTRLGLRLAALAAALDDLPAQARRFARWQARQNGTAPGRTRSPLRPGRPPGGRLSRFDPTAYRRSTIRDIDEVLAHAQALALYALEYPDTS